MYLEIRRSIIFKNIGRIGRGEGDSLIEFSGVRAPLSKTLFSRYVFPVCFSFIEKVVNDSDSRDISQLLLKYAVTN